MGRQPHGSPAEPAMCPCTQLEHLVVTKGPPSLTQLPCQAKVNDLEPVAGWADADNVLGFEVEVDDSLAMHVLQPLQDLPHVLGAAGLCVLKVIIHNPLKEFPTSHTASAGRVLGTTQGSAASQTTLHSMPPSQGAETHPSTIPLPHTHYSMTITSSVGPWKAARHCTRRG